MSHDSEYGELLAEPSPSIPGEVGAVVIGRNEGERLRRCLDSIVHPGLTVVYVDSGSTDGSTALARAKGVEVVDLDMTRPFTAARARNEGLERLCGLVPAVRHVQFLDGDCELIDGWLATAQAVLEENPRAAVVCGRLRERHPERSIYNRLAELEWDTPIGEVKACGGIAMMRVGALRQAGGFDPSMIAGEEPELCVRLRRAGWKVLRIDADMAWHDMAMTRFGQWWKRSVRAGHAYAEGAALHGRPPERHWVRDVRSIAAWGIALPLVILGLAWPTGGLSLGLSLLYPAQALRIARRHRNAGMSPGDARLYGWFCVLARFPHAVGLARYWLGRLGGRRRPLIEYKESPPVHPPVPGSPGDRFSTIPSSIDARNDPRS
jgi:GT2 family glycosyltransferase